MSLAQWLWARWRLMCVGVLLVLLSSLAWAQSGVQPVPALTAQVMDQTGTLSAAQRQSITAQLQSIERQYGSQVVVLMVTTTAPEDIAAYANRVASSWKIGRKDVGDGLLFVIAKNDRSLRLEVARSLEGTIPDIVAGRIIQNTVVPQLRKGDFAAAIGVGLTAIEARLAGDDSLPVPEAGSASAPLSVDGSAGGFFILFAVLFFCIPIVSGMLAGAIGHFVTILLMGSVVSVVTFAVTGSWAATMSFFTMTVFIALNAVVVGRFVARSGRFRYGVSSSSGGFSSSSSSSRSSSSSSSDSFSSGGGGSFGGGGASGKW